MRQKVANLATVAQIERELDQALTTLRQLYSDQNIMARPRIEYRIGALRRRKAWLEWLEWANSTT